MEDEYFRNYDNGRSYKEAWREFSGIDNLATAFLNYDAPEISSICVLGAASGEIFSVIREYFPDIRCYGCEINKEAHSRIPTRHRYNVELCDMTSYSMPKVDVVYSNSLQYLTESQVDVVLNAARSKTKYFAFTGYFESDEVEETKDKYRTLTKNNSWWNYKKFQRNGYSPIKGMWQTKEIMIWKSQN